ncbi:uncharacterized protein ASPGLDRAFT_37523 [Aspergillus glaucus CBS 516.65]|uniref:Uncharacterized protein n=1 Tax=Aspergillus glaucus CBS 516.65 TaxID=1160497 RepID=A0A1L9VE54_ASPGL|nr:hypothetical protein ASPGLDRAFT_37523 [Aspergillus glaucus CBS 516.65]OJJ82228.1 hypothetical protein ASPGLDRAFT_37523 [Aspergillus glaucus CBS 516.65]
MPPIPPPLATTMAPFRIPIQVDSGQPNVTTASNAAAPNPASHQSKVHGSVCNVAVNGGTVQNLSRQNVRIQELVAGQNALKHWVRSQGWRDARYAHEPG